VEYFSSLWDYWVIAGGVSFTHEKKDVDMGPVQIQHKQTKTVPISPILSAVALVGGIGLVVVWGEELKGREQGIESVLRSAFQSRIICGVKITRVPGPARRNPANPAGPEGSNGNGLVRVQQVTRCTNFSGSSLDTNFCLGVIRILGCLSSQFLRCAGRKILSHSSEFRLRKSAGLS